MKIRRLIALVVVAHLLIMADNRWGGDKDNHNPQTAEGLMIAASSSVAAKLGQMAAPVVKASKQKFFTSYSAAASDEISSDLKK